MSDVFRCIIENIMRVSGTTFFHVTITIIKLPGLIGGWRHTCKSTYLVRRVKTTEITDFNNNHCPHTIVMPGIVRIGELISSMIVLISLSISLILVSSSRISLMVCYGSNDFTSIFEPMEFLAVSRNIIAVSLPYLSWELSESRFVCLVGVLMQQWLHMDIRKARRIQMPYGVTVIVVLVREIEYKQVLNRKF